MCDQHKARASRGGSREPLETLFGNRKIPSIIPEEAMAADMGATAWG
jgi:hypothetical protein